MKRKSKYSSSFHEILKGKLSELGFSAVILKSCISYEVLFRKGRLWLGSSFDWRDQYLEIDMGHLYWFRDVMPRVIIIDSYSSYDGRFDLEGCVQDPGISGTLILLRDTLEESIQTYEERYSQILASRLKPTKAKFSREFFSHLGDEVQDDELADYLA